MASADRDTAGPRPLRGEGAAWALGLAASAAASSALLRLLGTQAGLAAAALGAVACAAIVLLLGRRGEPSARRSAAAAGAAAGWVVGTAAAFPTPGGWFFPDIAWHGAKAAVAAAGHPLQDPILRVDTLYPFLFASLVAGPIALGLSLPTAMWAAAVLSLVGLFWSHWRLARGALVPAPAAWTAAALPVFFHYPTHGFMLLAEPFNFSLVPLFAGLACALTGLARGASRRLAAGGLLLGLAGLAWYAHLPWLLLWALWLCLRRGRRVVPLLLGALPCGLVLLFHLAALAREGLLGASGIRGPAVHGGWPDWLALAGKNFLTLSGHLALSEVPCWIGPLLFALLAVSWLRRDRARPWIGPALAAACVALLGFALVGGRRLTYGEAFLWRYTFVLYALLLLPAAAARPWRLAGREVPALAAAALAAALAVPGWLVARYQASLVDLRHYEETVRPVQEFLETHTGFDEPVFAPVSIWEEAIACCAPRPNLVDRYGGQYKYAPASVAGPRWHAYSEVRRSRDPAEIAELLAPWGFRYAVVSTHPRAPGFETLADGFEVVLRTPAYLVVDLRRPAQAPAPGKKLGRVSLPTFRPAGWRSAP